MPSHLPGSCVTTFRLSIRQWIRPKLDVLDVTEPGLREFRHVRTVSRPNTAALPARSRIVNAPIHSAGKKRHGIGQAKDRELLRLRIEHQQGVRSRARDAAALHTKMNNIATAHATARLSTDFIGPTKNSDRGFWSGFLENPAEKQLAGEFNK